MQEAGFGEDGNLPRGINYRLIPPNRQSVLKESVEGLSLITPSPLGRGGANHRQDAGADRVGQLRPDGHDGGQGPFSISTQHGP